MATLKINLTEVGNACDQDSTPGNVFPGQGWCVFLNTCDGKPFVRAGKQYGPFAVDHGYVEIKDVPPGRYVLYAIVNPFPVSQFIPGGIAVYQSNYTSHFAVVDVCRGCHDVCVTLYNSGWHYCVRTIIHWFRLLAMNKQIEPNVADNAINAMTEALEKAGETMPGDNEIIRQLGDLTETFIKKGGPDSGERE